MYKVFINDKPLLLTNKVVKETDFEIFLLESIDLDQLFIKIFQNKIKNPVLYHPNEKVLLKLFKSKIPVVKAAGGLVYNKAGDVLFIKRQGKWDLPKGHIEKKENKKDAALREVEEETGVNQLSIDYKIGKTYHVFKRNGVFKLKQTVWYKMDSGFSGELIPQTEEDIEDVQWIPIEKVSQTAENSYANIRLLLQMNAKKLLKKASKK
ncbi:NUDIX domain-containing protein [Flavobacterium agricola]|uniref:NUDIX domain-containing protein n=1 Tax=Flavobacterium agricola TaxID=2870839 RepID=A0ABY6M308_9FLAO|nr:NUDIX domain-containing protein [Flavobacterium agricola]UYW01825.1 NUDIX domain-containing protein [Flavobacterium agricola]